MNLKEFAKMLDGREYGYPQFTKEEINIAKENGFVIIYGASDDLMEFEGAICDEADCFGGGLVRFSPTQGVLSNNYQVKNQMEIRAKWCEDRDENGKTIPWTYDFDMKLPNETFMIYEDYNDEEPYCRGVVIDISELQKEYEIETIGTFKKRFKVNQIHI